MTQGKKCFVICPIGSKGSDVRARSDDIFKNLIERVLKEEGYEPFRAIDESRVGEITTNIIKGIHDADLIVADLTYANPNVYYELGFAHATSTPFIHIAEEGTSIPFDINVISVIFVGRTFAAMDEAREQLRKQVREIAAGATPENPIGRYLDKVRIREQGTPLERQLEDLSDKVRRLESLVESEYARHEDSIIGNRLAQLAGIHGRTNGNRLLSLAKYNADIAGQPDDGSDLAANSSAAAG